MPQRVLVDANVISSRTLTDWLFHLQLSNEGMFSLYWTLDIQAEAIRVMRKRFPDISGQHVVRRFQMMESVIDEMVVFPEGEYGFSGIDTGDFHVHAAAVYGEADYLLTSNDPEDFTSNFENEPYEVISPDDFFLLVADSNASSFYRATKGQFDYYSQRGRLDVSLTEALVNAGCPRFASRVKTVLSQIALNS